MTKSFLVCALEPSANLHLKELLKAYIAEFGGFELFGIFDEKMMQEFNDENSNLDKNLSQNLSENSNQIPNENAQNSSQNSTPKIIIHKPIYNSHEFSAMGFVEVLPLIFKAKRAISKLTQLALDKQDLGNPFNAVLCIDSPAFNIPLAKALNKAGVRARKIYYILPQVWAWKKGRIPVIEANFDVLASILPFDAKFFGKSTFVGHPLLDEIKEFKAEADFEAILAKDENEKTISFLPGSRKSEIKRLMPIFRELALNFKGEKMLCVPPFNLAKLDTLYGDTKGFKVVTNTPQALKKSDFAFICSGTATLEAALIGTPFVLAYKAKAIDVLIARLFVRLRHIGLANIMCDFAGLGEFNPEFIQGQVSAKNLFEAYRNFNYKEFFDKVSFLKDYLRFGSAKNLAKILANKG